MRLSVYYGGTFDPIHLGHIAVAEAARRLLGTPVHFIPSADPPHRAPASASAEQRAEMVELAIAQHQGLACDRRELKRSGKSYSLDTLLGLRAESGNTQPFAWLIGMDAFIGLDAWHRWRALFDVTHFIIVQRPGQSLSSMSMALQQACDGRWLDTPEALSGTPSGKLYVMPLALRHESSTAIRAGLARHEDMSAFLPAVVAEYIRFHQLYASGV
ncbi:MAG: nicotinate-nucleotide adenylyltransferase [Arenimonas sp.]|nr:nicotinate-nucleotide adenylyltransferase [Arenimonas sp.]MBP7917122.1 nicotinate-nucleotide adenylyltransferase [Arenimonas sp.]